MKSQYISLQDSVNKRIESRNFSKKTSKDAPIKLGGTSKTNRVVLNRQLNDKQVDLFMSIAQKALRAEQQRNKRK